MLNILPKNMIEALNVNCKFHFSGFMSVMRERVFLPHTTHTHTHTHTDRSYFSKTIKNESTNMSQPSSTYPTILQPPTLNYNNFKKTNR